MTPHNRKNGWKGKIRKAALLLLVCVLSFAVTGGARADEHSYKVEAVFLYNFFNYITWPGYQTPEEMKDATICIADHDPVYPYLEYIRGKRVQERRFTIRQVNNVASAAGCQMIFVRNISDADLLRLRAFAAQNGVLVVSTRSDFIDLGGMIGISPEGERLAIEIDNSQLKQANFQISSRLLDLARRVK